MSIADINQPIRNVLIKADAAVYKYKDDSSVL